MIRRTLGGWLLVVFPALAVAASLPDAPPIAPSAATLGTSPAAASSAPSAIPAGAPSAVPAGAPSAGWDSYRILSERNIFVRDRRSPSRGRFGPGGGMTPPPVAVPPAAISGDDRLVLTGILQQGDDFVAFLEDTKAGKTTTAEVGDTLGKGQLTAVTLDAIEYTCDGTTTRIVVGSNLAGVAVSLTKPRAVLTAKGTTAAASSTGAASAAASSTGAASAAAPTTPTGAAGFPTVSVSPAAAGLPSVPPTAGGPGSPPAPATAASPAAPATAASPAAPAASTTRPLTAPSPSAADTPGDTKGGSEASILERMRQRREEELKK